MARMKGFSGIITLFIGITIAAVLVANVVMPTVAGANKTTWDTGSVALWSVVGIAVIAAFILMIL